MSSSELSSPTTPDMALADLISSTAFKQDDTMVDSATTVEPVSETPTKAKKGRKTPVKKAKAVAEDDDVTIDTEVKTPVKAGGKKSCITKTPTKKAKVAPNIADEGDADAEDNEEPTTPKVAVSKKRGATKKAVTTPAGAENGDAEMITPAKSSAKKRGATKAASGQTPTKKTKAAAGDASGKRAKAPAVKFPESWAEFTEEDKLIVTMRKAGKNWGDVEVAWAKLTGKKPGTDSIRKRYPKLEAVSQDFKTDDLPLICDAKKIVDDETEAAIKKLKVDAWSKIGERVKAAGGNEYKGAAIEKKWAFMKKSNQVNDKGEYIVPAAVEDVDEDMENLKVVDESAATNGNGQVEDDEEADAMEE